MSSARTLCGSGKHAGLKVGWERGRFEQSRWQKGQQTRRLAPRDVLGMPSARLARSQIVRGARNVLPSREALILLAVINHPWLLETHAEELAELEFRHADGDRLRRAILDAASGETLTPVSVRAAINARELGAVALHHLQPHKRPLQSFRLQPNQSVPPNKLALLQMAIPVQPCFPHIDLVADLVLI